MIQRCTNPKREKFKRYGARGIVVCNRWRESFENFLADMGERPEGTTIDRFPDNDGPYSPDNCRWATAVEQSRNCDHTVLDEQSVRAILAERVAGLSYRQLAERFGVAKSTIRQVVLERTWKDVGA